VTAVAPLGIPATPWLDLAFEASQIRVDVPDLPELRRVAQRTWIGRMVNEHASGRVFDQLAEQLAIAGAGASRVKACREFAAEERHHGALCAAVACALGAEPRAVARASGLLPTHADAASQVEATLRNLLSISCMSETIAVTIITAEREQMPEGDAKRVLSKILADEIGHARFGWGFAAEAVPTLDDAAKARTSRYLEVAFAHVEQHELAHLPDTGAPPEGAEAVGVCSGREARALFYDTIEEVVVPRLEAMGLAAGRAWQRRRRAPAMA
jgi:hypothetical protein